MADTVRSTYTSSTNDARATVKGTKIVKAGSDMDKNAFLKILSAELSNQDPTNAADSTQYVTQMAQFVSMEQMSNLNNTMSAYAANSLIGRQVKMNINNTEGVPYSGTVKDVTNKSGTIKVGVEINNNGKTEILDFDYNDILTVGETATNTLDNLSSNTALLTAASLIGKKAELNIKDSDDKNITGTVKGIVRESGVIKIRVEVDGTGESQTVTLDSINKLDSI